MDLARINLKYILILVIGIVLVLNPLYLVPGGGGTHKITYKTEKINNSGVAAQALSLDDSVLQCPGQRPCAIESHIVKYGNMSVDTRITKSPYHVVTVGKQRYIPISEYNGNTTELSLKPITNMQAVKTVAVNASSVSPLILRGVKKGSVTVYGRKINKLRDIPIIRYKGSYYWYSGYNSSLIIWARPIVLLITRGVMYILGIFFISKAGHELPIY